MTETQMKEFLAVALQAATSARELILSYYNGEFDIEIKSDQTPVTVADRGAEQVIRKTIQEAFPGPWYLWRRIRCRKQGHGIPVAGRPHRRHQELCETLRYVLNPDCIDAQW